MKVHELLNLVEDDLQEGPILTPQKAKQEIIRIAGELKIASSELIGRYLKALKKAAENTARAVSQLELSMNLPRGRLKGFDQLVAKMNG